MKKLNLQKMTTIALLVALLSVSAYIVIPLPFSPVPLTAQTLVVNLTGLILGPLEALAAMIIYILLGLCGAPVFSGGMGGPAKLFGPTGGYILAWILAVVMISLLKGRKYHFIRYAVITIAVAIIIIDGIGTVYLKLLTGNEWHAALAMGVYPYIPLDIAKCIAAAALAKPIQVALPKMQNA